MKKGFTLIELMIVVAIIAIIAAIAIPSLLRSRMATNATAAAAALKALIEAQEIYHRTDYDTNGVLEYSFRMGGPDGAFPGGAGAPSLYTNTVEGDISLIDRAFANAEAGPGAATTGPTPKAGYVFAILSAQGANAPGGAKDWFDTNGRLTFAHGGCASPAQYDNTGRDTFIISSAGTIYQKDLGVGVTTLQTTFDPDTLWVPSE